MNALESRARRFKSALSRAFIAQFPHGDSARAIAERSGNLSALVGVRGLKTLVDFIDHSWERVVPSLC